jgi:hypothetical protein
VEDGEPGIVSYHLFEESLFPLQSKIHPLYHNKTIKPFLSDRFVDKITIINFEVTLVVLEDQLLAEVV